MLELGEHLVRELGIAGQRDTLARWLSHHIAELIKARSEDGGALPEEAVSLIIRLWEHRRALPGKCWPIAELGPMLEVMDGLRPDANPWRHAQDKKSARLESIHDGFVRLMVGFLLFSDSELVRFEIESGLLSHLDAEEAAVASTVQKWCHYIAVRAEQPKLPLINVVVTSNEGPPEQMGQDEDHGSEDEPGTSSFVPSMLIRTIDGLLRDLSLMKELLERESKGNESSAVISEAVGGAPAQRRRSTRVKKPK